MWCSRSSARGARIDSMVKSLYPWMKLLARRRWVCAAAVEDMMFGAIFAV